MSTTPYAIAMNIVAIPGSRAVRRAGAMPMDDAVHRDDAPPASRQAGRRRF
ncbi:hypothetical protein [Halomonas nitroreducens]|uniref:hypothetical protein n=1 Tax=Halomonas nitroreducens TaxID=447425 RepID=UPI001639A6EF|nr:hypothetical protein [Halomonas nitroreducens]